MRGAIHLVAIFLAALGAGCASNVKVVFDEREDLAGYRTWDWFPGARADIDAPDGEADALDARLARLIEQGLRANGFARAGEDADFFVTYRLVLRRQPVVVDEPSAVKFLTSYTSQGAFVIEGSEKGTRIYQEIHLAIGITGARGQILWRGQLVQQEEDSYALKLNDAVAMLFERFPRRRSLCGDADSATESAGEGGGRDRKDDSNSAPRPEPRCPDEDGDADRPEPLPRRLEPPALARVGPPIYLGRLAGELARPFRRSLMASICAASASLAMDEQRFSTWASRRSEARLTNSSIGSAGIAAVASP